MGSLTTRGRVPLRIWLALALVTIVFAQSPKEVRKIAKQGPSALPELTKFLLNPDSKVRIEAVKGIIEIGGPRTVDPLVEATQDNDPQIQSLAVNGLVNVYLPGYVRTGFAAPIRRVGADIRSVFASPDEQIIEPYIKVRADVIKAVGRVAQAGASLDARATAARASGVLRAKEAVPDLLASLRSKDTDVLLETLIALEKIHDPSACSGMHFLLRDLSEKVQIEAVQAHGVLGCRSARPDLRDVLKRTDREKVRRAALSALAMMPESADRELFSSYLEDSDDRLRIAAGEGYARLADIEDARKVETAFESEMKALPRLALAFALVTEGNLTLTEYSPLRHLINALNNNAFREYAIAYLTEAARNPEVRRALYSVVDSGTRDEKTGLARVISASGDRDSVAVLEKLSHDPDPTVSEEGVRQLRNLHARI